jgi:hypothetical protein
LIQEFVRKGSWITGLDENRINLVANHPEVSVDEIDALVNLPAADRRSKDATTHIQQIVNDAIAAEGDALMLQLQQQSGQQPDQQAQEDYLPMQIDANPAASQSILASMPPLSSSLAAPPPQSPLPQQDVVMADAQAPAIGFVAPVAPLVIPPPPQQQQQPNAFIPPPSQQQQPNAFIAAANAYAAQQYGPGLAQQPALQQPGLAQPNIALQPAQQQVVQAKPSRSREPADKPSDKPQKQPKPVRGGGGKGKGKGGGKAPMATNAAKKSTGPDEKQPYYGPMSVEVRFLWAGLT